MDRFAVATFAVLAVTLLIWCVLLLVGATVVLLRVL